MLKKIFLFASLAAVGVLFLGTGVFLYAKSIESPVVYETGKPFHTDIVLKTVATGKIIPRLEVDIKSQVSGVVETIFVRPGDLVKEGDLLAKIRIIPDMERLSAAESQLETARISLSNASRELDRARKLFEEKLISETELNKYELDYALQHEAVSAAVDNVALIKEGATSKTGKISNQVKATVDGTVLDVPVKEGTFVIETNTFNEGTTIASIADMTDMIFEGKVDESEVGKLRQGMELVLDIGAIETEPFVAELEYISPKGVDDQGTIKFDIRAAVKLKSTHYLRAGYSANADIVLDKRDNVLAINEKNLIFADGKAFVDVEVASQQFERREVVTGLSDGINIEIVEGLTEGEVIKLL
ncbi:MAG TPA: efflux RND transporter periplasmic adaptor subunit [Gammaproteobacteria bacterium]